MSEVPLNARRYESTRKFSLPRNPKHETRNWKPEARNPKHETRNMKLETQNSKSEKRRTKPETRGPKSDIRNLNPKLKTRNTKHETRNSNPLNLNLHQELQEHTVLYGNSIGFGGGNFTCGAFSQVQFLPHGGLQHFYPKSSCRMQFTLGSNVV